MNTRLPAFHWILVVTMVAAFLPTESAQAKNRHSVWSKVKSVFSKSEPAHQVAAQRPPQQQNFSPPRIALPAPRPTHTGTVPQINVPAPHPVKRAGNSDPMVQELRRRAEHLSKVGLPYKFGGSTPGDRGMDCSGTMQYLLKGMGFRDIPRTSYAQYEWVKNNGDLRRRPRGSDANAYANLRPGDLIFWGGTYNSGHKVSHVMLYLGRDSSGRHFMFGAKGSKKRGLNGSGVDVFELKPGSARNLVGYGHLPGRA